MKTKNPWKILKAFINAIILTIFQLIGKRIAYRVGYRGKRLKGFSTLGHDSTQEDRERATRVYVINRNYEAPGWLIDFNIYAYRPVLAAFIRGLKDGYRDLGNDPVLDLGRQLRAMAAFRTKPTEDSPQQKDVNEPEKSIPPIPDTK